MPAQHLQDNETQEDRQHFEATVAEIRTMIASSAPLLEGWRQQRRERMLSVLGDDLPRLESSLEALIDALNHDDPDVRRVALHLSAVHWKHPADCLERCVEMATSDQSQDVRQLAMSQLGDYASRYPESANRLLRLLAGVVCDEGESIAIRKDAYSSLCWPSLRPNTKYPDHAAWLAAVDWGFVRSFLDSGESA